jgi:hypothetical protein
MSLRLGFPQKLVTAIRLASSPQAWVGTHPKLAPPGAFLLQRTSPLLAQSGHHNCADECPLSKVKRTLQFQRGISAVDPKRTSAVSVRLSSIVVHSLELVGHDQ